MHAVVPSKARNGWIAYYHESQKKLGEKVVNLYKTNKLAAEDVSQLLQTADEAGLEFPNPIKKKKVSLQKALNLKKAETRMQLEAWIDIWERHTSGLTSTGPKFPWKTQRKRIMI